MKWINYHHLIYFREIAQKGTISKASETLKVGQPALSSQLKSLENYLGIDLFERRNKRLFLTEAGKVVLQYAEKINDLGQELLYVVDNKGFSTQLQLRVGALDSIPKHLICDIVDFAHKKTGCFLTIVEGSTEHLSEHLAKHDIEVMITDNHVASDSKNQIFSKNIINRPVVAYASPEFKHLADGFPYSLSKAPCIVPTKHSKMRNDIEHFFELNNIEPNFIAETQDTALQKILAAKGDGVIFLPEIATQSLVSEKKLVKLGELESLRAEYYLTYNKKVFENPALDLVTKQNFEEMSLN